VQLITFCHETFDTDNLALAIILIEFVDKESITRNVLSV